MSTTQNLGMAYLTAGQLQPEVTVNGDLNLLDGVLAAAASFAYNPNTTTGLTYGYYGGFVWSGGLETSVAAGTVALTASATNYLQMTTGGVISANTTGFISGNIPLAQIVTGTASITSIADMRPVNVSIPLPYSLQTPVTGFAITIASGIGPLLLNPAGTLASGTVTMPAAPIDGQIVRLGSTQAVTTLSVAANTGQTINGAITTIAANGFATWIYAAGITKWMRIA